MQPKKLTPLEILQKQKNDLQARSNELSGTIENRVIYLQKNFVPLLRDSLMESAISKMPTQLLNLAGNFIPFFISGKKVKFLSIIVKQIIKYFC